VQIAELEAQKAREYKTRVLGMDELTGTHPFKCMFVYTYIYICIYVYTCKYMCIYIYIYMCVCVCVCVCVFFFVRDFQRFYLGVTHT